MDGFGGRERKLVIRTNIQILTAAVKDGVIYYDHKRQDIYLTIFLTADARGIK